MGRATGNSNRFDFMGLQSASQFSAENSLTRTWTPFGHHHVYTPRKDVSKVRLDARHSACLSGGPDRTRICDLYRVKVAL
jgi:hypothetical protein